MEKKHQQEEYVDFVVTARKYKTLLTAKYKSRPMWHKPSAGDVVSHLPGTIIKIMVEEGQAEEAGQLLLLHDALKQPDRVDSPISGGDENAEPGGRSHIGSRCRAQCKRGR